MSKPPRIAISFVVFAAIPLILGARGVHGFRVDFLAAGMGFATWSLLRAFSGNRDVSIASSTQRNGALQAPSLAGCGIVYVYRDGFVGKLMGFDVILDGQVVAQLKTPRFTRLDVPLGQHVLGAGARSAGAEYVPFSLQAGEVQVFRLAQSIGRIFPTREQDAIAAKAKLTRFPMVVAAASTAPTAQLAS